MSVVYAYFVTLSFSYFIDNKQWKSFGNINLSL